MAAKSKNECQAAQYALIVRSANGEKINGTGCPGGLENARKIAADTLRLTPAAAFVDIHPFVSGEHWSKSQVLETVHRSDK